MNWETTRGHLRRLDRARHGLYITAYDLQVEVGQSEPFYKLDPFEHKHTTKSTRWRYLWDTTWKMDLQLHIHNFWTPKPKFENDINIMDKAHDDVLVKKSKCPLLYHINMCRLYVRAFTIGDLTKDGETIHIPYLDGSETGINQDIAIPPMRRPTVNQRRVWKSFIFRTFLSPGTRINPPLGERINGDDKTLKLPNSETDEVLTMETDDIGLKELMQNIPVPLRGMVGTIELPLDEGIAMSEVIVDSRCISASDGSLIRNFQKQEGAHGYAIRECGRENDDIIGYGPSPKSDDMSSMTTEHYGLIRLLVTLHMICLRYSLCQEECFNAVLIYVDNKTVVERCNKKQVLINLSDYSVPDQDLWALTTELLEKIPIRLEIRWVQGHQDENRRGNKIHGPFPQEVQMKILVDELASRGLDLEGENQQIRPTFKNTAISV